MIRTVYLQECDAWRHHNVHITSHVLALMVRTLCCHTSPKIFFFATHNACDGTMHKNTDRSSIAKQLVTRMGANPPLTVPCGPIWCISIIEYRHQRCSELLWPNSERLTQWSTWETFIQHISTASHYYTLWVLENQHPITSGNGTMILTWTTCIT